MNRRRLIGGTAALALALAVAWTASPRHTATARSLQYEERVLIRGAAIHGANGLAVDARGRLIVASFFGGELVALDRRTGRVVDRLGHDVGIDGPDDVAVGPDGSLYWTELGLGQVGRLAPNGVVTKQTVAPGMNPIAFSADGRLFAAQAFYGDGLYELDPRLVRPPRVVIPDSRIAPFTRQLNAFAFGPDGKLYAPQPFQGRIVRIDPNSGATTPVATTLPARPAFSVRFDSRGRLYAGLNDGGIARVDRSTGALHAIAAIPAGLDNMVFDRDDRLYVSSYENGGVYTLDPDGRLRSLSPGGLTLPGGVAVMNDSAGRESLFVADPWRLIRFDPHSGALLGTERYSFTNSETLAPSTVAPDGRRLIVTSWVTGTPIRVWDPLSRTSVQKLTDPAVPLNAIRVRRDVVVAELQTRSVARWDHRGAKSIIASGLSVPAGLAATDDDLWVADRATGIVWKLIDHGKVLPSRRLTARGLHAPEGLALDRDGSLLVVEAGDGTLSRIDTTTRRVTSVVRGLKLGLPGSASGPPTGGFNGVAVGRDGTVFVTGDSANVVYRLRPVKRRLGPSSRATGPSVGRGNRGAPSAGTALLIGNAS